jgi:TP901 family phage tail tape measure protein
LNSAVRGLAANVNALNAVNVAGLTKSIVAPKFQWQEGLRQTDQLVKNIQKGKLSATEFFDVLRNRTNELAQHQARISRAFATPLAGGATAVTIPAANSMKSLASTTELANRKLAVQAEVLHGLGQKVQDWGKNTQWAGRQMMVGMTVPFTMGAAAAAMYANKIDASMVRVEKVVNDNLDGFREKAMNTAKEITNTMGQTIESSLSVMAELAAAGFQGPMLQSMTKLSQELATLGDMDQQEAIKGMISIQQIFKLSTDDLAKSVDYLNSVEDQTPTKLQDLVDAIPIAGVQVAQLGGTLQDTTVLLTAFREKGIATVEGANAIKTAMNRILSPTAAASALFKELTGKDLPGLVKSTEGKPLETFQALSDVIMGGNVALSDQQRIISKLVGTYQSSRITALLSGLQDKNGSVALTKEIGEQSPEEWAARTARSMKSITESASGQWRIAVESFKAEFIQTGNIILRVATGIVQAATKVFEFFNNMPDIVKMFLIGGGGILALAGPVTMIIGILGNFLGTITKVLAVVTGARSKYKSMTIEERAAELAAGTLNTKMMSQADTTQVLIYQMDKLRAAYIETTNAAQGMAMALNVPNPTGFNLHGYTTPGMTKGMTMPIGGFNAPQGGSPLLGTNAWSAQTNQLIAQGATNMQAVAAQTQKAGRFQKIFNSETLIGVGAATALAGMVTETGSGLSNWLNWISLASVALGGILPLVTSIGQKIKGWASAQAAASMAGSFANAAKGFGSKLLAGGKTALSGLSSFIMGPWGLAIGGALAAIWGITKLINATQEEQNRHQQAMVDSTDSWMKLLNKTKVEWGQIRDDSGEVKDNIDSIVKKMREEMPDLVGEMANAGPRYLETLTEREALKLEGQGLNKKEILNSLDALLQAAGRSRKEIDKILGNIEVKFDFAGGEKDLKQFIATTKGDLDKELKGWVFDMPSTPEWSDKRSPQQDQSAQRLAGLFYDRLAGLDPAQRALFAQKWADSMNHSFDDAFNKLEKDYGKNIAKNWKDAKKKFFTWDADDNKWVANNDAIKNAGLKVGGNEVHQMEIMIDTEQRLTQAIAKTLGVSEDKYKSFSILSDIMPYVTNGNITAAQAQDAYNKALKEAKDNGKELSQEEKNKLAQLLATQFGLDAATLANNGYAESNKKAASSTQDQAYAMQIFIDQMKSFTGAADDFWNSTTQGEGGFADSLGGDVLSQAQSLTDSVKGIYSGAMNDIYSAMADQAQEQWQARLDAITKSFEDRREAIQNQVEALDKSWDDRMEQTAQAYDDRKKAIEDESQAQIDSIDNQIKAEQDREDARQRQFEAEKKRIERLAELANRNIDYNRALASGQLDEAARVMNNTEAVTVGWNVDDAREQSSLLSKNQVEELNASKELAQKQKQARLDALAEEEAAVKKSMEVQKELEKERLQNKLDSLAKEQASAEETERKKQAMDRRTLEIELATLKAFVPQNEAELAAHVARISSAYANYGLNLQTAGGYWGQIIGNALQNNVDRARAEMSNNAQWAAFGNSVAGAISQGAFGLSLSDFFTLIATGQPPAGWKPPGWSPPSGMVMNPMGSYSPKGARHGGGLVDDSPGSRNGRGNSPLGSDEMPMILQRGEFVFPRSAVQLYGSDYLKAMASGTPPQSAQTVGIGGITGGSVMAVLGRSLLGVAMNNMMGWAAQQYGMTGGTGAAVDFAKAQDGKPYIWGSAGPNGYDCSGYMSAIANVLTGKDNPYKRIFSTGMVRPGVPFGPFVPGLGGAFSIGVKGGNPGHTAGTLLGVPVESTGNHVRYGKDAHGASDKQFNMFFHVPDDLIAAGAAIPGFGFVGGEPKSDEVQQRVKAMAAKYGWAGGAEWIALYNLIQGESGWNPYAANPTSTARGLFQKLTSVNGPIESTIEGQASWGLNYIKSRYGDPINAYNKWLSRHPHWYDSGGDLPPGLSYLYNGTNQAESIITYGRTGQLMDALDVANVTYRGLQSQVKSLTPSLSGAVAEPASPQYNDNISIVINGSDLNQKQLQSMVADAIEEARIKRLKRTGKVK